MELSSPDGITRREIINSHEEEKGRLAPPSQGEFLQRWEESPRVHNKPVSQFYGDCFLFQPKAQSGTGVRHSVSGT